MPLNSAQRWLRRIANTQTGLKVHHMATTSAEPQVRFVSVFAAGPAGGNPAPIVVDAAE
jgi:hypothetical protein